jgi:protein involved in polysaccharide export with SLBB domain
MRVSDVITGYSVLKTFETLGRQDEVRTDPPGISKVTRSEGLIGRLGGDSDSANLDYAVIERLGSTGFRPELLPFSIANVLADSKSPDNLTLLPGDIITVFSDKDVQVPVAKRRAFVRIEGEVNRPGVYQVLAGERLLGLLEKAGGITPDAYLYGLAVYREGVRQSQRENIDRLLRQVERESSSNLAETAQNVGVASDSAMFQARNLALQKARQDALQRLRAIRPDGRLTLSLKPDPELDIGQIPDIRLSHADRIVIPPRPELVYVSGAVNAEAALVYRKNADAASYLRIAGVSGAADRDAIFILRADGSAVTNQSVSWFNDLTKTIVMPGDLIVVPEKLDRESSWSVFIRNSKDITQTLFQLGLGAAAIKTLRQ